MKLWPFGRRRDSPDSAETKWVTFTDGFKSDAQWYQKVLDFASRHSSNDISTNTAVSSCVNLLSQEVASLPVYHWKVDPKTEERRRVPNSAVARVLRRPNSYQTRSDFWLQQMRALLLTGNMIGVAARNLKTEVTAIHPRPPTATLPFVNPENGDVYYQTADYGDGLFRTEGLVPAENVLHVRINCNRHPLVGETPITALSMAGLTGNAIQRAVARFHSNMARPSGVLMTPKPLNKKQIEELREQFESVTSGENIGRTPVLHTDLKWESVMMSAVDADTIKSYNLTVADIAMAYRVPLFMLGDLSKATFRNVETLMRLFYASSLRFYLEHIENALDVLFELDGESEYVEFDIESGLLRGDFRERMDALAKGVQGGILTPNEARKREQMGPVDGGDEAFLQKQMVPISAIADLLKAEEAARVDAPKEEESGDEEEEEEESGDDSESRMVEELRRMVTNELG